MSYTENLGIFIVLLAGIIILPGTDMLFVVGNSLTGGRRAGLAATGGMMAGGLCHAVTALVGVAVLIKTSPWLFAVVLYTGGAYMIWVGLNLLRSRLGIGRIERARRQSLPDEFLFVGV